MKKVLAGSPLRGPYFVQNPILSGGLAIGDRLLGWRGSDGTRPPDSVEPPQRLLLAIGGHLGDVVIGSSVLPAIREAWPQTQIGVLVGSWGRAVIAGHPEVKWVHVADHWKLNRSVKGVFGRLHRHFTTRRTALQEMRGVEYDMAIDLHPFFPNAIPLLRQAGIPRRIGYTSAGFGPFLTDSLGWEDTTRHRVEYHADLLRRAGVPVGSGKELRYSLPPRTHDPPGSVADDYVIIHMGAGSAVKEWPTAKWSELVDRLLATGYRLVFTGSGQVQAADAEGVIRGRSGCTNLCNRVDWDGFVATVAAARLMVCVDSVAGHVAAAVGTPVLVLMSGINRTSQWIPVGEEVQVLTNPVPCAPCFRSRGCEAMTCVRGIRVEDVLASIEASARPLEGR